MSASELAKYMKAKKLKDGPMAALIGVSRPYVSRLRRKEKRPSIDVAAKIETVTGIPASSWAVNDASDSSGEGAGPSQAQP